jgi:hypothetical protein
LTNWRRHCIMATAIVVYLLLPTIADIFRLQFTPGSALTLCAAIL